MRVLLLGAGASTSALEDAAPVVSRFGASLTVNCPDWSVRFPFLRNAIDYLCRQDRTMSLSEWRLDEVWDGIDQNAKLGLLIANPDFEWPLDSPASRIYQVYRDRHWGNFWVLAGVELRRLVALVYGTNLIEPIMRYCRDGGALADMVSALNAGDVLITTNYDLLSEGLLRCRFPDAGNTLNDAEDIGRFQHSAPLLLKLHGSLDWDFMSRAADGFHDVRRTANGEPMPDQWIGYDEADVEHRPLLVAPVSFKDELLVPQGQPEALLHVLTFQWHRALQALVEAEHLTVVGYRFPPEDLYSIRVIRDAMRRRTAPLDVDVHLPIGNSDVVGRVSEMAPPGSCVRLCEPL